MLVYDSQVNDCDKLLFLIEINESSAFKLKQLMHKVSS